MTQLTPQNQQPTQLCSPARTTAASTWKHNFALTKTNTNDDYQQLTHSPNLMRVNKKSSITQQQILSHPTIAQIIQKSKSNTVDHNVNIIPINTKLYNIPLQPIINQFKVQDVTQLSPDFVSTSSQKIKQFHIRLSDQRDLGERLEFLKDKNKNKCEQVDQKLKNNTSKVKTAMNNNMRMTQSNVDNVNRRVSVSGLVSYNFNSVSARRSIGSIPNVPEQVTLAKNVEDNKRRNSCSVDRNAKILSRKASPHNRNIIQFAKAAVSNFETSTDQFLLKLREQSIKRKQIYGERMQKLDCVRQFMEKQKADYEHAHHIVETIIKSQRKQVPQKKKDKKKIVIDDDKQLAKRRKVLSSRRIMMKNLYFTD